MNSDEAPVQVRLNFFKDSVFFSDKEIQFTDAILCYHNLYRDGADLEKLEWNTHLAKFAADWAAELKDNNECMMKHSEHDARKNLGR